MLASRSRKPAGLPSRGHPHTETYRTSLEPLAPRSSSFGKLNPFNNRDRIFGGHFRRTNDSTVKVNTGRDLYEDEGVLVDHSDYQPLLRSFATPRIVDIGSSPHLKKLRPASMFGEYYSTLARHPSLLSAAVKRLTIRSFDRPSQNPNIGRPSV